MITNDAVIGMISTMCTSCHWFYITGSRYFGNVRDESDWDFFVQDSEEVQQYLVAIGFQCQATSYYIGDKGISSVWAHPNLPIHVQVVKNAEEKNRKQQAIYNLIGRNFTRLPKHIQTFIWNT